MSAKPTPRDVAWLVRQLDDQSRRLRNVENRKPGLAYSSIEDGAIREYDKDGVLGSQTGKQPDGTHGNVVTNGPKPPRPVDALAVAIPGIVEVRWNGKFAGDVVSPLDLKHVAAYVVPVGEVLDLSKQAGVMTGELGDSVQAQVVPGVYNVYLVAWSKAGRFSDAAGPVPVLVSVPADMDAIQGALDDLDEKYDGVIAEAGTLGTRLDDAEGDLLAHEGRLDSAELDIDAALAGDVDVDRISIGTGVIRQLVAEHIAAKTATFQTVDVKNLFATTGTMSEAVITKLFTDVVMSRKITAEMVAIGAFDNLIENPSFELGGDRWVGYSASYFSFPAASGRTGSGYCRYAGSGRQLGPLSTRLVPHEEGDTYRISAWVRTNAASGHRGELSVYHYGATGAYVGTQNFNIDTATDTWARFTFLVKPPTAAFYVRARINATLASASEYYDFDDISLTRAMNGSLVVDGSIKAIHADLESFAADTGFIADLTARIVKADMFVGQEFHGGVFTGATFQSAGAGAGFQLTEDGYTSRDEAGNVTVRLPSDGTPAQFKGDIEASSLTASGRVSFQAPESEVASGANLVLESGVQAPASPPTVGDSYPTFPITALGNISQRDTAGLAYADGVWWRAGLTDGVLTLYGSNEAGSIVKTIPTGMTGSNGIVALGGELYALGRWAGGTSPRDVAVYNPTTGAFIRRWAYPTYGTGTYQPAMGTDGTNILIAQCWASDGKVSWRSFNKTSGALIAEVHSSAALKSDIKGIHSGAADYGTTRVIVTKSSGSSELFTTSGALISYGGWFAREGESPFGVTWASGSFWYLTRRGRMRYSGNWQPTGTYETDRDNWWVALTWTGALGRETQVGPGQRFTFYRRSEIQVSGGLLPPGATGVRVYMARKDTTPARADYRLVASQAGTAVRLGALPSNWATGATPPATNSFPNATPGTLKSRASGFEVKGDGSGKWGPLTFNADGTMTSAAVPAWVPVTTFESGFSVGDFGFPPAGRVWPDGKVEWRGVVKGTTSPTAGTALFSFPAGTKPPEPVNMTTASNNSGGADGTVRIEFGPATNANKISVYPAGAARTWVSLDGLYYYLF